MPVYLQIAEQLSGAIRAGEREPGHVLPPERVLAESLGAGRASIREALRAMQAQGLILAREGAPSGQSSPPSTRPPGAVPWLACSDSITCS